MITLLLSPFREGREPVMYLLFVGSVMFRLVIMFYEDGCELPDILDWITVLRAGLSFGSLLGTSLARTQVRTKNSMGITREVNRMPVRLW